MSDDHKVVDLHPHPLAAQAARLQRIVRKHRARLLEEFEERIDHLLSLDPSKAGALDALPGLPFPIEVVGPMIGSQLDLLEEYLSKPREPKP